MPRVAGRTIGSGETHRSAATTLVFVLLVIKLTNRNPSMIQGLHQLPSPTDEQKAAAKALNMPVDSINSIGMQLKVIPAGTFTMGDSKKPSDVAHQVTLTQPFRIGVHEVTQEQYERVMGSNPSTRKVPQNPVESISWHDAVEFCRRLSELPGEKAAGRGYRLPTEAEWEYACRAGKTTRYSFGDDVTKLGEYCWFGDNSGNALIETQAFKAYATERGRIFRTNQNRPRAVGAKKPNPWGLYDMHGNVYEWCQDWWSVYPSAAVSDPKGPEVPSDARRMFRGGSWFRTADLCRSAMRNRTAPTSRDRDRGFRVVCISNSQ